MPRDRMTEAARARMKTTGESFSTARRAVQRCRCPHCKWVRGERGGARLAMCDRLA